MGNNCNLGDYMKYLKDCIKKLFYSPNFTLYIPKNNLGSKEQNLKELGNILQYLSNNIITLKLYLSENKIGENEKNIKIIG